MTLINAYPQDWGISRYEPHEWDDEALCRLEVCTVASALQLGFKSCLMSMFGPEVLNWFDFGAFLTGHAGDSEGIRFLIGNVNGKWDITHIDWKMHHEKFGNPEPIDEIVDDGLVRLTEPSLGYETHPVLYISKGKHAAYPTKGDCEDETYDLSPYLWNCHVAFEHCGPEGGEGFGLKRPSITMLVNGL